MQFKYKNEYDYMDIELLDSFIDTFFNQIIAPLGPTQEAYERVLDINYFKLPKRIKTIKNRIEKTKSSGHPKIPQSTIVKLV